MFCSGWTGDEDSFLDRQVHVAAINEALAAGRSGAGRTVALIGRLIEADAAACGAPDATLLALAGPLYHDEMAHFRRMTDEDLDYEMICGAVRTLSRVARVTQVRHRINSSVSSSTVQRLQMNWTGVFFLISKKNGAQAVDGRSAADLLTALHRQLNCGRKIHRKC